MRPAFALLALAVLSGQTPAPSPSAAAPLRHLEYSFTIHKVGMAGSEYNGMSDGIEGGSTIGDGGQGTMDVDVLSISSDGALIVRISERVSTDPRPRQAYTCTVYGNTTVVCPSVPAPSQAEWLLLRYLGRSFVDSAPWDAQHHWGRSSRTDRYALTEDFTMSDAGDGKHVVVLETEKVDAYNGGMNAQTEDVRITYDRSMEVPDAVHDVIASTGESSSTGQATIDFQLRKDSFAKQR